MDANETAWLEAVGDSLTSLTGTTTAPVGDDEKRVLLRATKVTADATGIRYLAPLTAYLIGWAAGASGEAFDLRRAADAVSEIAAGWAPPEG